MGLNDIVASWVVKLYLTKLKKFSAFLNARNFKKLFWDFSQKKLKFFNDMMLLKFKLLWKKIPAKSF